MIKRERVEILERLGPIPYWRGERKSLSALGEIYTRAIIKAKATLAKLGDKMKAES